MVGFFLLINLPNSWETFRVSMISVTPNGIIPLQMEKTSALNEKMRRKARGTSSQSGVLVTEKMGKSQKKKMKGGRNKSRSKSRSRYKDVKCHYCHRTSHIQRNCFLWKKESKDKKGKQKKKDHVDDCVTTATSDDLVILPDLDSLNLLSDESMWIIDNGATLHVTTKKEFFISYTLGDFGVLKMGNDGVSMVIGVGDVCLQTNIGMRLLLRGVKHAPNVRFKI